MKDIDAIKLGLSKLESKEWRHVGQKENQHGEVANYIVAGDYANEGEPDLVIEVWGSEDDAAYAEFITSTPQVVQDCLAKIEHMNSIFRRIREISLLNVGEPAMDAIFTLANQALKGGH